MRAESTFAVTTFEPTDYVSPITTGSPVGFAFMDKQFDGDVQGRARTQFTSAFDPQTGVGTYVAMESFEGTLGGRRGAFNLAHSATTTGTDRLHPLVVIVPGSGTGELEGLAGTGEIAVDADGTHRLTLDYELTPSP
jgi:hypothetical protein